MSYFKIFIGRFVLGIISKIKTILCFYVFNLFFGMALFQCAKQVEINVQLRYFWYKCGLVC